MADKSTLFALVVLGVIGGSGIMLYGVQQTSGEELNALIVAGGVVILGATGIMSIAVSGLEGDGSTNH